MRQRRRRRRPLLRRNPLERPMHRPRSRCAPRRSRPRRGRAPARHRSTASTPKGRVPAPPGRSVMAARGCRRRRARLLRRHRLSGSARPRHRPCARTAVRACSRPNRRAPPRGSAATTLGSASPVRPRSARTGGGSSRRGRRRRDRPRGRGSASEPPPPSASPSRFAQSGRDQNRVVFTRLPRASKVSHVPTCVPCANRPVRISVPSLRNHFHAPWSWPFFIVPVALSWPSG